MHWWHTCRFIALGAIVKRMLVTPISCKDDLVSIMVSKLFAFSCNIFGILSGLLGDYVSMLSHSPVWRMALKTVLALATLAVVASTGTDTLRLIGTDTLLQTNPPQASSAIIADLWRSFQKERKRRSLTPLSAMTLLIQTTSPLSVRMVTTAVLR